MTTPNPPRPLQGTKARSSRLPRTPTGQPFARTHQRAAQRGAPHTVRRRRCGSGATTRIGLRSEAARVGVPALSEEPWHRRAARGAYPRKPGTGCKETWMQMAVLILLSAESFPSMHHVGGLKKAASFFGRFSAASRLCTHLTLVLPLALLALPRCTTLRDSQIKRSAHEAPLTRRAKPTQKMISTNARRLNILSIPPTLQERVQCRRDKMAGQSVRSCQVRNLRDSSRTHRVGGEPRARQKNPPISAAETARGATPLESRTIGHRGCWLWKHGRVSQRDMARDGGGLERGIPGS